MHDNFILTSLTLYFVVQIFFTQYIYSYKYFVLVLFLGLVYLGISFFGFNKTELLIRLNVGSIICYYISTLYVIKIIYGPLNEWLIKNGLIDISYREKDFTHIGWNSNIVSNSSYWNKRLADSPSVLDRLLTYYLLFFPLLIVILIQLALVSK